MDEQTFQVNLIKLIAEIGTLPIDEQAKLLELAAMAKEKYKKLKGTVGDPQESIDFLRLSIKYLLFDLEATRRENATLRAMLEDIDNNDK